MPLLKATCYESKPRQYGVGFDFTSQKYNFKWYQNIDPNQTDEKKQNSLSLSFAPHPAIQSNQIR